MKRLRILGIAVATVLSSAGSVWAQAEAAANGGGGAGGGKWILSYFIVGLGIVLGLVVICRPGKRTAEVKRPVE